MQERPLKRRAKAKDPSFNGGTATQQADTRSPTRTLSTSPLRACNSSPATPVTRTRSNRTGSARSTRGGTTPSPTTSANQQGARDRNGTYDLTGAGARLAGTPTPTRAAGRCGSAPVPQRAPDRHRLQVRHLIHEWSHAVADTDDHVYGETAAGNLANTIPARRSTTPTTTSTSPSTSPQSDFGKALTFITDRSQFGHDEVDALLADASPAAIENGVLRPADGFWPDKLGITTTSLGASPEREADARDESVGTGMTIEVASLEAEDPSLPIAPQRFTWVMRASSQAARVPERRERRADRHAGRDPRRPDRERPDPPRQGGQPVRARRASVVAEHGRPRVPDRAGAVALRRDDGLDAGGGLDLHPAGDREPQSGNSGGQTFDGISTDQQTSALELAQQVNGDEHLQLRGRQGPLRGH